MPTSEADHQEAIESGYRFERLLADLATSFVGLPPEEVDGAIEDAQRRVVETLGLDRSSLFQLSSDGVMTLTHTWVVPGLPAAPRRIDATEHFPWCYAQAMQGKVVRFSSLNELPPEAARDLESFRKDGQKSMALFPFAAGGQIFGGLAFGALREERHWTDEEVTRLRVAATLFESTLAHKRSDDALRRTLDELQQLKDQLQQEKGYLQAEINALHGYGGITGNSLAIRQVLAKVDRVAATDATVLLLGETGTGKGLLAETIHAHSRRSARTMVAVNCAALSPTLIEAELFGREKGAYTGALSRQAGRFELADGSTLFLDEVAELQLDLQVKLLRVLQDGQFERVGGTRTLRVDVRVIAASNRDLAKAVVAGQFREDLYYRLNAFPIVVPPLRERQEDIPALAWTFAKESGRALGKPVDRIPQEVMAALRRYAWPGNIRELRNAIERAIILGDSSTLRLPAGPITNQPLDPLLTLDAVERASAQAYILKVLERTGWRIRGAGGAAELLGLKPTTLEARMKKFGIQRPTGISNRVGETPSSVGIPGKPRSTPPASRITPTTGIH
ncbi:MAG: GAF domain-containing protein [Zetaproteobacteria bacterium]|nr:MAG: GAF domain-containing protein [Zetaproteobacteria bacterium]